MSLGFVRFSTFNAHQSESNLINTGKRLPGETIKNDTTKKFISKREEAQYKRDVEKRAMNKRQVKVTLPELPF